MEKLKFNLTIYVSVIYMAKHGLNENEAIVDQLNQGDSVGNDIVEKLEEIFGQQDCIDTIDFMPFIEGDKDSITLDLDENASIGSDYETVALAIDFTFDVEKFAKEYDLEKLIIKEEYYGN